MATVLIIDDEPGVLSSLADVLADEGHRIIKATNGVDGLAFYRESRPDLVFLDIWLPDRDGLEVLHALREIDPDATVLMISGHGTVSTAVKAIKMGAFDYLEKPLSYKQVVEATEKALRQRPAAGSEARPLAEPGPGRLGVEAQIQPPPSFGLVRTSRMHEKTIGRSTVIYGLGLHSGTRTGMVLQPLPPNSGIHFLTLPAEKLIAAHVSQVADTEYATTLSKEGASIKTVEHLLSALHAFGITNLLVKVHGEIPVLDGSAVEFCKVLQDVGIESQKAQRRELVVDRLYQVGPGGEGRSLTLEPYDGFKVSYLLRYPPPIGEQYYEVDLDSLDTYRTEIAPARTFGFMRDLKMLNELGLGSGGRLDNFILVGEDDVINTELRFPDEFARHKILDIVGDLYLLGFPIRGHVKGRFTGHRDNIAMLREILRHNPE